MPVFQIDVEKTLGGEFWTNVYYVQAGNLAQAVAAAQDVALMERSFHYSYVLFTKARVRTTVEGDFVYETVPINEFGQVDPLGSPHLPLFNVLRADFQVGGSRPSRKYYKLPILENNQNNGLIDPGLSADVATKLNARLEALATAGTPLCDPQGQILQAATTFRNVGMRQLRRGSKRKLKPII